MPNIREERFKKIAVKRVNNILEDFRLLGNCSNKGNYEYTDDEVRKIFEAIEKELIKCKNKFKGIKDKEEFRLWLIER